MVAGRLTVRRGGGQEEGRGEGGPAEEVHHAGREGETQVRVACEIEEQKEVRQKEEVNWKEQK